MRRADEETRCCDGEAVSEEAPPVDSTSAMWITRYLEQCLYLQDGDLALAIEKHELRMLKADWAKFNRSITAGGAEIAAESPRLDVPPRRRRQGPKPRRRQSFFRPLLARIDEEGSAPRGRGAGGGSREPMCSGETCDEIAPPMDATKFDGLSETAVIWSGVRAAGGPRSAQAAVIYVPRPGPNS
mmetsp:Transcript_42855/g.123891  ORF Transcript_42855/g.123891 Transcript_42855/m.123891 type:complete len:185 (-) Transcript_42855:76-630(-)